jgi:hypothetical protein
VQRILYAIVVGGVALGGLVTIADWARRGDELPGGGVPVTGRVIEEQPGFSGALAIVEVAYEAGGKERRARLPVPGSDAHPTEPTYRPGDTLPLLVSRTNPGRVHHADWSSDTPDSPVPGWLLALAAAAVIGGLALPGAGRRMQAVMDGLNPDRPGPAAGRRRWPEP